MSNNDYQATKKTPADELDPSASTFMRHPKTWRDALRVEEELDKLRAELAKWGAWDRRVMVRAA